MSNPRNPGVRGAAVANWATILRRGAASRRSPGANTEEEINGEVAFSGLDRNAEFDQALDDDGDVDIRGHIFRKSDILATDPVAYQESLVEWQDQRRRELYSQIIQCTPFPVAHNLYRFCHSTDDSKERLDFFRDTFESSLALLHAIALGEMRARSATITIDSKASEFRRLLVDRSLAARIDVIRVVYEQCPDECFLASLDIPSILPLLNTLKNYRNEDWAHTGALNQAQAETVIEQFEPILENLLRHLRDGLGELELLREYKKSNKKSHWRFETFKGPHATRTLEERALPGAAIQDLGNLTSEELLVSWKDRLFSLSPLVLWREGNGAHFELLYFKKEVAKGFEYEIFGNAHREIIDSDNLREGFDGLRRMVVSNKENK